MPLADHWMHPLNTADGTGTQLVDSPPPNVSVSVPSPSPLFPAAACRLAEVVRLLRKRPSLKETGLLWKLQHSLAESVAEQERLHR